MPTGEEAKTALSRFRDFQRRYRRPTIVVLGVVVTVWFILARALGLFGKVFDKSDLLSLLVFILLVDVSFSLAEAMRDASTGTLKISRDQQSDNARFQESAQAIQPSTADLLEYSAVEANQLIVFLKQRRWRMRILVKHPDTVGDRQRQKILTNIRHLRRIVLNDYQNMSEVRCYRQAASLRGRVLGKRAINVGWYTPDVDNPELEVRGHSNPMITANAGTPEGGYLLRMFDGLFERLWHAPGTEDAYLVLGRIEGGDAQR